MNKKELLNDLADVLEKHGVAIEVTLDNVVFINYNEDCYCEFNAYDSKRAEYLRELGEQYE